MDKIQLDLNEKGRGAFFLTEGNERIGEMEVGVNNGVLTAYHTEVSPKAEGKGIAKQLLQEMVGYARENKLQVVPLCAFVHAQFKRHPEEYKDIWRVAH